MFGCARGIKKSRHRVPGLSNFRNANLRCATLTVKIFVIFFVLTALFLAGLLAALLAALSGLVFLTLLTGLVALLTRLSALLTLLPIAFHIVCHQWSSHAVRFAAHFAILRDCFKLVARVPGKVGINGFLANWMEAKEG
jgi:hypothetical protein